jgi:aspartate/glutamate racemase
MKTVKQELGGFHSARIIMYSVDFEEIEKADWPVDLVSRR